MKILVADHDRDLVPQLARPGRERARVGGEHRKVALADDEQRGRQRGPDVGERAGVPHGHRIAREHVSALAGEQAIAEALAVGRRRQLDRRAQPDHPGNVARRQLMCGEVARVGRHDQRELRAR